MMILAIGLLSGQAYYFGVVYPKANQKVVAITQELEGAKEEVSQLEDGLKRLPRTKQELENTKLEVVSLIQRMPSYASSTKDLSDMLSSLSRSNFTNIKIDQGETIKHQYEGTTFIEKCYTLTYTAPFTESKQFVESLNGAYRLVNVRGFNTNNHIQTDQESQAAYKLIYGEQFKELVETKLDISFLINPQPEEGEIYDSSINILSNSSNALMNLEVALQDESAILYNTDSLEENRLEVQRDGEKTDFKLAIESDENKKDYYRLTGPVSDDANWATKSVTLTSKQDVYITLRLTQEGYQLILKGEDGKLEQASGKITIKQPQLYIEAQKLQGEHWGRQVHIQVENDTDEVMIVDIEGTMLGNLHLYNEEGIEVKRGGVKGKLIVR